MVKNDFLHHPTIGFLTANIHIGASRVLWPGILDAADSQDVNLIYYPVGRPKAASQDEAMRSLIYQLVDTAQLAGLVICTSAVVAPGRRRQGNYIKLPLIPGQQSSCASGG